MRAFIAKYWKRLRCTEDDTDRGIRSFWLQFAAQRFPDVKSAAELVRVAEMFAGWHRDGAIERDHEPAKLRAVD